MSELNRSQVQAYARLAGALYLVIIILGVLGEAAIRNRLIVWGDSAATAQRILESEFLWRVGIAGQMILLLCAVTMTFTWYVLFRPVNRKLTVLAIFFAVISLAVESIAAMHLSAVLAPLTNVALKVLDPQQIHALVYLSVVSHADTFGIALIFFGVEILIIGYLIRKSGYFPKIIGAMMQIAGLCYLLNSFCLILFPSLATILVLLPAFIGESAFCLWLLVKGVNAAGWEQQLSRANANSRASPQAI